jgi:hypothetical protein
MIAAPGDGTLLRADAEVVWLSQRPAAEHVPAGVTSIEVTRLTTLEELLEQERTSRERGRAAKRHARGPTHGVVTLRRVIVSPAAVRRLVAAIDALPIVQPGAWVCPAEPFGPVVRLSFRGHSGRVLAKAAQAAGDEVGNCSPMYFSVRGREQKPLAKGASVIGIVSEVLGVRLLPG